MAPIERAARALCENPSEDPDELIYMSDGTTIPRWQAELWRVRAVLDAIREPSGDMVYRGCINGPPADCASIWKAMIDKMMEEGR